MNIVEVQADTVIGAITEAHAIGALLRGSTLQQLLAEYRKDLFVEQAVDVACARVGQQAGGNQRVIQGVVDLAIEAVMALQAFGDLGQLDGHDALECIGLQRAIDEGLKACQQRRLEVVEQDRPQLFVQHAVRCVGLLLHTGVQQVAAEVGGHQNDGVAKVDLAAFTVAHKAAIKDLIKQIEHVAMSLFHFVEQHNAVGPLAHRFG